MTDLTVVSDPATPQDPEPDPDLATPQYWDPGVRKCIYRSDWIQA